MKELRDKLDKLAAQLRDILDELDRCTKEEQELTDFIEELL